MPPRIGCALNECYGRKRAKFDTGGGATLAPTCCARSDASVLRSARSPAVALSRVACRGVPAQSRAQQEGVHERFRQRAGPVGENDAGGLSSVLR